MPPNQPKKVPTNHFKIWSEIFEIHRSGVRSYRIRPHSGEWVVYCRQWMMKRQIFEEVFCWYSFEFERTSVGAYRIRPHGGEWGVDCRWKVTNFVEQEQIPCHGGRIRYAPTPVRLLSCVEWMCLVVVFWWYPFDFNRKTVGAYRIRPDVGE